MRATAQRFLAGFDLAQCAPHPASHVRHRKAARGAVKQNRISTRLTITAASGSITARRKCSPSARLKSRARPSITGKQPSRPCWPRQGTGRPRFRARGGGGTEAIQGHPHRRSGNSPHRARRISCQAAPGRFQTGLGHRADGSSLRRAIDRGGTQILPCRRSHARLA